MQRDAERGWSEQENLNDEFSEEIANVVAAINNSFSNWKELQVVAQCSLLIAQCPCLLRKHSAEQILGAKVPFLQAGHTEVANKTMQILAALEQVYRSCFTLFENKCGPYLNPLNADPLCSFNEH